MSKHPWKIVGGFVFAIFLLVMLWGVGNYTYLLSGSGPRITPSPETTGETSPLTPDGYLDVQAVLAKHYSAGVTPGNNAAIPLIQATGLDDFDAAQIAEMQRSIGSNAIPGPGPFVKDVGAGLEGAEAEESDRQRDVAMAEPWRREALPMAAAWLDANEIPLAHLAEALKRDRYYRPLVVKPGEMLLTALLPDIQGTRALARLVIARAMLHAGDKQYAKCRDDLLACHRLARLICQGSTLVDALVGFSINTMAVTAEIDLVQSGALPENEMRVLLAQLEALPADMDIRDVMLVGERLANVDTLQHLARGNQAEIVDCLTMGDDLFPSWIGAIDWNEAAIVICNWQQRGSAICQETDAKKRVALLTAYDHELEIFQNEFPASQFKSPWGLLSSRAVRGKRFGAQLALLLLPAYRSSLNAELRTWQQEDFAKIALALTLHRAKHGTFPAKLDELSPEWLKQIPVDRFTGDPLHYQHDGDKSYLVYSVGANLVDDDGLQYDSDNEDDASQIPRDADDLAIRFPPSKKPSEVATPQQQAEK